ncbi:MAG: sulfurtransferase TusA family protein [Chloroflexota bacterium]
MATQRSYRILDTMGLLCPMPVVKAKLALEELVSGEVLQVLATDPASPSDFASFCRETGNKLLKSERQGKVFTFLVEKG